jgi:hypothetical protein
MNCSEYRKVLECGGNPARLDATAFERQSTAESDLQQRAKAVSPLRSATALHDASVQSTIIGQSAWFGNR